MTTLNKPHKGWIGVDLDGTLAYYEKWEGPLTIGAPIAPMVALVRKLIAEGKVVKIFTARIDEPRNWDIIDCIEHWCKKHIGTTLEITNVKDKYCEKIYDDRAVGVVRNTGELLEYAEADLDDKYWEGYDRGQDFGYDSGIDEGYERGYEAGQESERIS